MEKESLQIGMDNVISKEKIIPIFSNEFFNYLNKIKLNNKNKVVCFTGNRPASLPWKYNEDCELCKEFKKRLKDILITIINSGYTKFISGVAMGFDIIAAEIVLDLKKENYNIELECAVPCLNQTRGWKQDYIKRYQNIIDNADKVSFTSNYAYFEGCYAIRNRYMVDNASLVIGCQLKKSSGTSATLNYARLNNRDIIIIN